MNSSKRKTRRQEMKQSILDAARHIISEKGADRLNMRAVADEIGYSPGVLYGYFGGKQDIIESVASQGYVSLARYLHAVDQGLPPKEYLVQLSLAYIRFALDNPDYYLVMFTTVPSADAVEEIRAEGSAFDMLLRAIQRGVEEGVFATAQHFSVRNMAYAAWANAHGLAMLRITFLSDPDILSDLDDRGTIQAFYRGLQAKEEQT